MKLLILGIAGLIAADQPPLTLDDKPVPATIHGAAARLRVDPGGTTMPILNPDFAAIQGIKSGMIGTRAVIGPVGIHGHSAVVRFDLGRGMFKRRATWFDAPVASDVDAVAGPGSLPDPVIRFALRPSTAGERSLTLPLADFGYAGMGVELRVGAATLQVLFRTSRARSLAIAPAGAEIADAQGGRFAGAAEAMPIMLGVARPVRRVTLARPLAVGPLALDALWVRTADFGSAAGIAEADAPAPDPDEIVVKGGKPAKGRRMRLEIGSDDLARCSSILFDKPRRQVTLSCR